MISRSAIMALTIKMDVCGTTKICFGSDPFNIMVTVISKNRN